MKRGERNRLFARIAVILITVLVIWLFIWSIVNSSNLKTDLEEGGTTYGATGIFVLSGLLELVPQYISPHISLFSSAFLGLNILLGFLLVAIGSFVGSFVGFEIGKSFRALSLILEDAMGHEACSKMKNFLDHHGKWYLIIAALSPLPYVPLVLGMLDMKRRDFFLYGVIPRMIGFLIMTFVAYGLIGFPTM
jgi:membrane protein YqaA with SNARE-associated domain